MAFKNAKLRAILELHPSTVTGKTEVNRQGMIIKTIIQSKKSRAWCRTRSYLSFESELGLASPGVLASRDPVLTTLPAAGTDLPAGEPDVFVTELPCTELVLVLPTPLTEPEELLVRLALTSAFVLALPFLLDLTMAEVGSLQEIKKCHWMR